MVKYTMKYRFCITEMKRRVLVISLITLHFSLFTSYCYSQEKSLKDTIAGIMKDTVAQPHTPYNIVMFGHETALFAKSPIGWKGKNWALLGGCVATTYLSMQIDNPIRRTTGNDPS